MPTTYFGSALRSGSASGDSAVADVGAVVLAQTVTLQAASAANVDATITLPANGRILDIKVDSTVAWTATTASLTIEIGRAHV